MPHPTYERSDFIKKGAQEIIKLLEITKGKSLILFTSKNDLKEVYNILSKQDLKYKLLVQRMSSSQDEILEEFKKDEDSVLLATGTFWEGIDIPGKALSNLIVFRLPFPVPDPIIEYKRNTCDDFLMEVSVPYMIVKLRQGVGRLIRKHDDKGIVAILDSRIGDSSNSKYKDIVFDSLPIKNRSNDIELVKKFWNKKCKL
ncbi:helicase c2 [Romboutsia lituseburensis]|nr:helicase c2 [Romboutsia lituseburensis]